MITIGFVAMVCTCLAVAVSPRSLLAPAFLLLGISVGVPMSAVTLFTGRNFPERCAALLTFLNFSWSVGALAAPLIAARILMRYDYRAAYILFAIASAVAAIACSLVLRDGPEPARSFGDSAVTGTAIRLIAVFAFAAFLQVGIENTVAAWLPTYALRMAGSGIVLAAVSTSFYWAGFLASRGLFSVLLLRAEPVRVFRSAVVLAFASALFLELAPSVAVRNLAMFLLGASLAPIYPLVLAAFFARTRQDRRFPLDSFHSRLRRFRPSLGRRLYFYSHRQSPRRHAHDSCGAPDNGAYPPHPSANLQAHPRKSLTVSSLRPKRRREAMMASLPFEAELTASR